MVEHVGNPEEQKPSPPSLTTEEGLVVSPIGATADFFKIPTQRLRDLAREGRIRGVKPGHEWFVSIDDVQQLLNEPPAIRPEHPSNELPPALKTADGLSVYPLRSVAAYVGRSREYIHFLVTDGLVQSVKPGQEWFVSASDVENHIRLHGRRVLNPKGPNREE